MVFKNLFTNPDVTENVKLQLAAFIPAGTPIIVANDAIEILPDNIDKTFNNLSKESKEAIYLLRFLLISSLLISLILFSLNWIVHLMELRSVEMHSGLGIYLMFY